MTGTLKSQLLLYILRFALFCNGFLKELAMLYSHIIFLCVSLADLSKAELLQVYKYKPETVELAAWTGNVSTFQSFSRTACGGRATRDGRFSFAFDASEKTCKVGALDLETTEPNGDGESVMLQGEESTRSEIIR